MTFLAFDILLAAGMHDTGAWPLLILASSLLFLLYADICIYRCWCDCARTHSTTKLLSAWCAVELSYILIDSRVELQLSVLSIYIYIYNDAWVDKLKTKTDRWRHLDRGPLALLVCFEFPEICIIFYIYNASLPPPKPLLNIIISKKNLIIFTRRDVFVTFPKTNSRSNRLTPKRSWQTRGSRPYFQ